MDEERVPIDGGGEKRSALFRCLLVYLLALLGAILTLGLFPGRPVLFQAAAADIVATLIVFVSARLFSNSSLYDPYWSVAPPLLFFYYLTASSGLLSGEVIVNPAVRLRVIAVALLVVWWAVRLTGNWIHRWGGLADEDWRYRDLKTRAGGLELLVDLFGIQLFPTIQVFLGCLALYVVAGHVGSGEPLSVLDLIALAMSAGAILLETVADRQLTRYRESPRAGTEILVSGVWSVIRHPNYMGEISFWWGLYLFGLSAAPSAWWTIVGPLTMTALFVFISVPMMDRHLSARYPDYSRHKSDTPALLPWLY